MKIPPKLAWGAVLTALLALSGPAGADDSTARLDTGGLVLTKNTAVEMRTEDLYLSDKAVRVKYSFVNTSPKPVTVTVAFPIPDIDIDGPELSVDIPKFNSANFLGFAITVDGKPAPAQLEQKAIKNGVDKTAYLKSLGIPVAPFGDATDKAIARLTTAQQDTLIKLGLAMVIQDASNGAPRQLLGTWTLKSTFFWNQTFLPGRAVSVEHDYSPSVGGAAVFVTPPATMIADLKVYCVDADLVASVRKATKPGETVPSLLPEYFGFVLVSGANWAAPIGDFHMVVDKGAAANLVSFCGTGVTKTGPTTFEVHYTNYTPKTDVSVLLLKPTTAF